MNGEITPFEKDMDLLLEEVHEFISLYYIRLPKRDDYFDMVGKIRDMRTRLENQSFGCSTGRHVRRCQCPKVAI